MILKSLVNITILLIIGYSFVCLFLYFFQSKMIYYPSKQIILNPGDAGLKYEDLFLTTHDGTKIHGWYIPHDEPRGWVILCHGNGGNVSHRLDTILIINQLKLSVLIFDYHGYGISEGTPSEESTYQDAYAAWTYLTSFLNIPEEKIIIWGRSLGGAVAVHLAQDRSPKALVLESTFTSIHDMAKRLYPFFPVKKICLFEYNSSEKIKNVKCPKLFIHSQQDDIVPFELGKKLFNEALAPKEFVIIQGNHNTGFIDSGQQYIKAIEKFLFRS